MKRLLISLGFTLLTLVAMAAAEDRYLPSNWGGWVNLSASVNDTTCYTDDPLPMQAAVSGETLHVFWTDWKPNAKGESCIYYRRSTDGGKTWEDARAVVASKSMSMGDINYVGGNIGSNSKWLEVAGQNVHLVTVVKSADEQNSELLYTYSTDGGQTFKQRTLAKGNEGDGHYFYGRPHVVTDGQTVVIAFQGSRYNGTSYKTRVLTSFDGGATFMDKEIDTVQDFVDIQVSGRRWAVLGNDMSWSNGMRWGNVYVSTSNDGGQTISTQNIAPIVSEGKSYAELNYTKGFNGDAFNYHPQMTLEGDVINVIFKGCAEEVERPDNDRSHTIFTRSTDGGKTWTKPKYLPGTTGTVGAIAAKGQNIYVLQTPNGPKIWHSHDGGQTWDVQERCYWSGRYEGYANFFELYIAPDDPTGQHVYMTACRALLVESKDGFRTVHRNFSIGAESWYGGRANNHSLTVLLDSKGTEHWLMDYTAPYQPNKSYFWNIVYRRNDPAPATTGKEMALDVSIAKNTLDRPMTNVTIPITPSLEATKEAITVECWVRVDQSNSFQIASLTNENTDHQGSLSNGGWYIRVNSDNDSFFSFDAGVSTELSVDGWGKRVWDRWRYQIKEWGLWHHVALTYDSKLEKDNIRFYVDGLLMGVNTERGKIKMGNNPIVIGRANNYYDPKGLVDNFAIYSRALTQEEIQQHLYSQPDAKDKDCRLLLTFDGSLQDKSQYHNDAVPLMDAVLVSHDGIRAPHPEFTMTKDIKGQKVYVNDVTQDGSACWWVLPYPGKYDDFKTDEKRHIEQDFSRDPGTYSYWLVAKGTGNCNAYAATSQMVTIGGLKRIYPEVAGKFPGIKIRIEGGYSLTYNKQPRVVLKQGSTEIEGTWDVEYGYDGSKITSLKDMAPATFNLWNAPVGKYDVIVDKDTLRQAFTVEDIEEPDVWVQLNGRERILWNKYSRINIDYGNRSNTPAYNTPLFIMLPDRKGNLDVQFEFDFDLCSFALDEPYQQIAKQIGDHFMTFDEALGDSVRVYSFMIPYIAPNSTNQLSFRMKTKKDSSVPTNDIRVYCMLNEPWGPMPDNEYDRTNFTRDNLLYLEVDDEGNVVENRKAKEGTMCGLTLLSLDFLEGVSSVIPGVGCAWNTFKTVYQGITRKENRLVTFGGNAVTTALACVGDVFVPAKIGAFFASFYWSGVQNGPAYEACRRGDPDWYKYTFVGSLDPNEMIGPWGPDDQHHYIRPIHNMSYTITFENKSSATAPAHEVFVTDTLDTTKYDLSTFSFSSFGWADTTLVVGGSLTKEFTRDVMYKVNGQEIMVRVSGQFDEKTGIARWAFVSLDKKGNEIEDPDLGFLVPNNDNRDGEGFVSFTIDHKKNPANGSTISNKATIVFDANDPIMTNTFVNTFDIDYPSSKVTKVEEKNGQLVISFSGEDTTSGIDHYTIYATKNGGEPEVLVSNATTSPVTIDCEPGIKYGFCSIATDRVGLNEPKDFKAEATLTTSGENMQNTTVTVSDAGYATFYDSKNSYRLPKELKAFIYMGQNSDGSLSKVYLKGDGDYDEIPADVAVVVEASKKAKATYTLTSTGNKKVSTTNMLHGSDVATTTTADGNCAFYKLTYGEPGTALEKWFGWFPNDKNGGAFRSEAHRAWLAIPKSSTRSSFDVDGEVMSIQDEMSDIKNEGTWRTLDGRRLNGKPMQKGVYIMNNKKVVVK